MEADFRGGDVIYDVVVALKSPPPVAGDRERGHDQGPDPEVDVPRGGFDTNKVDLTHTLCLYMGQGQLSQLPIRFDR